MREEQESPGEAESKKKYLADLKIHWDTICSNLNSDVDTWTGERLLKGVAEAFAGSDVEAQISAVERIRVFIARHLLEKAIAANDPTLISREDEPKGSRSISERDVGSGSIYLRFFSGTSGERVIIDPYFSELLVPRDEQRPVTNKALRDAVRELFSDSIVNADDSVTVPFA